MANDAGMSKAVLSRVAGAVAAAFMGAMIALLISAGGDQARVEEHAREIGALKNDMKTIQTIYATNKRVDDLQAEVRANYRDLSVGIDNVIKILLDRR